MEQATQQPTQNERDPLRRFGPALLVALALLLLLPGNNTLPLIDRDEPRFARATQEMIERGEWAVPLFNSDPAMDNEARWRAVAAGASAESAGYRFDKPILIYWLMRPCYALLGANEFAARLPSVICSALLVWLTFHIGARWFSATAGFAAGFGLLTCLQMLIHGRLAVADMPMVLCVLAAHFALFELLREESPRGRRRWFWLFYGALGVGFLAKGPVAVVTPAVTLLVHRFVFWRQPLPWRRLRLEWGIPLVLAIIAAWGIPALVRTHGLFWRIGIGEHIVARGHESFQGHGSWAPHYYLVSALVSLFPWIAFAGDGVRAVRRGWNERNAFLLSWAVGAYVLFTCYLTKLPHYVLPAFPALLLMLGQAFESGAAPTRWTKLWFWLVNALLLLAGSAVLAVALGEQFEPAFSGLRWVLFGAAGVVFSLMLLGLLWRAGRRLASALPLIGLIIGTTVISAGLRQITPATQLQPLFQQLPRDTKCGCLDFGEPSLTFYAARPWESVVDANALAAFLAKPGPRVVICQERELRLGDYIKRLRGKPVKPWGGSDLLQQLAVLDASGCQRRDVQGFNSARGSWVWLRVYYRL
ncbi:MAG: glycosyltransferase family 39 protein [Verrucomicrobia bacterium]|nr:glycosyltransferase family 39 protein [Verrucomicrobiota bacterium]